MRHLFDKMSQIRHHIRLLIKLNVSTITLNTFQVKNKLIFELKFHISNIKSLYYLAIDENLVSLSKLKHEI